MEQISAKKLKHGKTGNKTNFLYAENVFSAYMAIKFHKRFKRNEKEVWLQQYGACCAKMK
jgi:hypothetical protein